MIHSFRSPPLKAGSTTRIELRLITIQENSCVYIFSKESFRRAGNRRIGLKPFMYEINKLEAIDIDEEEDFKLAEYFFNKKK